MAMLRRLLKGLDSTPSTPKMTHIELPDVGDGDVIYISTSETSAYSKAWSSDSEDSSSPRSPVTPLRRSSTPQPENLKPWRRSSKQHTESPLSPRRGSTSSHTESCRGNRTATPISIPDVKSNRSHSPTPPSSSSLSSDRSASPIPAPAPVKPRKGILKPAPPPQPVALHYLLLPYDPARCKKKIYFNIEYNSTYVRDATNYPPVVLKHSDLEKPAAGIPLSTMDIRCSQLPHWDIHVSQSGPGGIRCLDVYEAIYEVFHKVLTPAEKEWYIVSRSGDYLARCEEQFEKRCKESVSIRGYEKKQGMRRVDMLLGRTVFMGLRRPVEEDGKPDSYWVLELGLPNDHPKAIRR